MAVDSNPHCRSLVMQVKQPRRERACPQCFWICFTLCPPYMHVMNKVYVVPFESSLYIWCHLSINLYWSCSIQIIFSFIRWNCYPDLNEKSKPVVSFFLVDDISPVHTSCECEFNTNVDVTTDNLHQLKCAQLLQNICSGNRAVTSKFLLHSHWQEVEHNKNRAINRKQTIQPPHKNNKNCNAH